MPYDRTYHLLARLDKVRSLARSERPDVLEAHSPYLAAAAVVSCGRRTAPIRTAFWHSDHLGAYIHPALAALVGNRASDAIVSPMFRLYRALLAPFDAVFVAGTGQAHRLRGAGLSRVVHVPFGIDSATFRPGAASVARRSELLEGAAPSAALIVGVGRLAVEKRWDVVLDAFGRLRAGRDAVLVMFGDGPERARLQRRAPPGVRFMGFDRDRARLAESLASADVLVHGCPWETSGLVVAEAVASGLPVVVPDAGGAAEHVDAASGETYRSLDPEACASAIDRLLRRDGAELRARTREAAARTFTLEQHFSRVLATYDVLSRERVRPGRA